jgi:hypothetical protein
MAGEKMQVFDEAKRTFGMMRSQPKYFLLLFIDSSFTLCRSSLEAIHPSRGPAQLSFFVPMQEISLYHFWGGTTCLTVAKKDYVYPKLSLECTCVIYLL